MRNYAFNCTSMTSLSIPDTSNITTASSHFIRGYAYNCSSLTSLSIPDTSSITFFGGFTMRDYAVGCTSLERLELPAVGWFAANNVAWGVPAARLDFLKGYVQNATDLSDWQDLTVIGETLYTNFVRSTADVINEAVSFNPAFARRALLI